MLTSQVEVRSITCTRSSFILTTLDCNTSVPIAEFQLNRYTAPIANWDVVVQAFGDERAKYATAGEIYWLQTPTVQSSNRVLKSGENQSTIILS